MDEPRPWLGGGGSLPAQLSHQEATPTPTQPAAVATTGTIPLLSSWYEEEEEGFLEGFMTTAGAPIDLLEYDSLAATEKGRLCGPSSNKFLVVSETSFLLTLHDV